MNTIDIHNGWVRNLEWQAKKQAQLDRVYEKEYNRNSSYNNNNYTSSYSNDEITKLGCRISALESRINRVEEKIDDLYNKVVSLDEGNGLFVFTPDQNVNAPVAFKLTDYQFKELMRSINR